MTAQELQKRVEILKRVKRPIQVSKSSKNTGNYVPHMGCIATTSDKQEYLIENALQPTGVEPDGLEELHRIGGPQGSRIVKINEKILSELEVVKIVPVKTLNTTLNDLMEASGMVYNFLLDNCWNSTQRMEEEVSGELQVPWQLVSLCLLADVLLPLLGIPASAILRAFMIFRSVRKRIRNSNNANKLHLTYVLVYEILRSYDTKNRGGI